MIIEHVGGLEKQEAYFHRMSKVKLNGKEGRNTHALERSMTSNSRS